MANIITAKRLREVLHYDPKTGVWTRLVSTANRVKVGDTAGNVNTSGYLQVVVDCRFYLAHRLAWFYMTGAWPVDQIDHINGIRDDNRFSNLRQATNSQNKANSKRRSDNKSGYKGVHWDERAGRFKAHFRNDGKVIDLGYFDSPDEAHVAYVNAARKYYGEYARGN